MVDHGTMEPQVVWCILHQFTPWNLEEDIFLAESSCPSLLVLLEFRTPAILTNSLQEVLLTGDLRAPKRRTQRSPHTNHLTFCSQGVEKTNRNRNVFFSHHLGSFSISRVGNHGFCCFPHLISLAEEWIHDLCFFSHRKCLAALWKSLRNRWRRHLPENHRDFFYACKASNHEVFSGLGDGWGGVPSSGFFEGLDGLETLRQKDGMISKGDLNFQGDKMISYWKEKHQKIILLMIFEALCSVFVILWNDFWSFSSVMFFFDIDTINVSRNLDMRCQKFPHRPGSISLATIAPGRNGLMQRLRIQKLYWKMNTLLGHWSNKLAVTNPL